jgi:antitoxin CptB
VENNLRKQLLYRSTHHGCKETDFLIGEFVKAKLENLTKAEVQGFSQLLEEDDLQIYDWILGKDVVPEGYAAMVAEIQKFHKI